MNWDWLRDLLRNHAPCLWHVAHFTHIHIAVITLICFVVIGLFQTYLAYEAGVLAVKALPLEVGRKERIRYQRLFASIGIGLFILTVIIGLLNDKNQRDADDKSNTALATEQKTQAIAGSILTLAQDAHTSLVDIKNSKEPGQLTPEQQTKLATAEHAAREIVVASTLLQSIAGGTKTQQPSPVKQQQPAVVASPPTTPTLLSNTPINFPPPPPPGHRIPPPYIVEMRKNAVETAQTLIDDLKKQDAEIQGELFGSEGIATQQQSVLSTQPADAVLPSQVQEQFVSFQTRYPRIDLSKVSLILNAVDSLQLGSVSIQGRIYNARTKPAGPFAVPKTVGDLRSLKSPTFGALEKELRSAADTIRISLYMT